MPDANLQRLLDIAHRRGTDPELVWPAALAAVELLLWRDQAEPARDLALDTLSDLGQASERLAAQTTPLTDAMLAAAARGGEDPAPALVKAAETVPGDSVLGKQLRWIATQLPGHDPHEFALDAQGNWPRKPLRPREHMLASRDLTTLTPAERDRLWKACHHAGQYETARRLLQETGELPPRIAIVTWMVGNLVRENNLDRARSLLLDAVPLWRPSKLWDVVPYNFTVQPLLRAAVTEQVRERVEARIDISQIPGVAP